MPAFGRTLLSGSSVAPTRVSADGNPHMKPGGITLDLTTLPTAPVADVTLPDGSTILAGVQYMRYGQVLTRIGVAEVQTLTFTGGPTAGSATITLPASGEEAAQTAAAVAFNASAAVVAAALQALSRIGPEGVTVARAGAGSAGDPYVYTLTFNRTEGDVPQLTSTHTFTGGTSPTTTHATTTGGGTSSGKYGPYDPDATDGRQTLARGSAYILDQTYVRYPSGTSALSASQEVVAGLDGGLVFVDRILHSGTATHTLALGPTLAEIETLFPRLAYADN